MGGPTVRLAFENVFNPNEKQEALDFLRLLSKEMLLAFPGFSNKEPQPNHKNFFTDLEYRERLIQHVQKVKQANDWENEPNLISRECSLKIGELILSNEKELLENNPNDNFLDSDELNLFKAILTINSELNDRDAGIKTPNGFEMLVEIYITSIFPSSDFDPPGPKKPQILKLAYATMEKFDYLIEFLSTDVELEYLQEAIYQHFRIPSIEALRYEMRYLFFKILSFQTDNGFSYRMKIKDKQNREFLDSLVSNEVIATEDFVHLRNTPLYKIEKNIYSVFDHFFCIEKFYKSLRFVMKKAFDKKHNLPNKDGRFFQFYTTEFSEKHLASNVLNKIFHQKFLVRKKVYTDLPNEPDYYVRNQNKILLFEVKDNLIAKKIKSSGNIEMIDQALKTKFLHDGERKVGIGQLVESISQIINKTFHFDDFVNSSKNFTIYPILLVADRVFDVHGINYRLNEWYKEEIKKKLKEKYNRQYVKDLTIIDIDTLIYWTPELMKNPNNLKKLIDTHLKIMNQDKPVSHNNPKKAMGIADSRIQNRLKPISLRKPNYKFSVEILNEKFKDLIKS